jgi:endonuclease I
MNSTRGNKDFDEGGSKVNVNRGYGPGSSFSYSDSDSFEPRAEVKGDVARILFYMATRYEGEKGEPDLELNDRVNNGSAAYHGRISVLIRWHHEDPVDDFERNRNEVIYSYQGNRNPFIDYPEFADMIWGSKATTSAVDAILNLIAPIVVDPDAFRRNKFTLFTT